MEYAINLQAAFKALLGVEYSAGGLSQKWHIYSSTIYNQTNNCFQ